MRIAFIEVKTVNKVRLNFSEKELIGFCNKNHITEACLRVKGKYHTACCQVRPDHLHHPYGESYLEMVEAIVYTIGYGTVSKERRKALAARLPQGRVPADIEISLLLACKGCCGEVLCCG